MAFTGSLSEGFTAIGIAASLHAWQRAKTASWTTSRLASAFAARATPTRSVPPWRRRSRSPLRERQGAVLEAHWRNLESRRGGRQGRARTRGIYRHFLSLLKQRIERLLSVLAPRSQRAEAWNLRVQQIDERTRFLNNNWHEDKHIVLPGLREWAAENLSDSSAVAIESELRLSAILRTKKIKLLILRQPHRQTCLHIQHPHQ